VTNVPGPQLPLYLQGARLLELYPQVPLMEGLGLGIALVSYDGHVHWGFNFDPDVVPDADVFVEQIRASYARVAGAAKLARPRSRTLRPARKRGNGSAATATH
jgi:diacylglycerol O-acyltransferase / wax synthase